MGSLVSSDTLGTNTTGYSYPGDTVRRAGVPFLWDKYLWDVIRNKLILQPLVGKEGSGLPIISKNEFRTKKGDQMRLAMYGNLTGLGKFGNRVLEGNEEVPTQSYVTVSINQLRHAWRDDGELSRQRDMYNLNKYGGKILGDWYAHQIEQYAFNTLYYGFPPHELSDTSIAGLNSNSGSVKPCRNWKCADEANNSITYSATDATYIANISAAEATLSNVSTDWFGPEVLEGVAAWIRVNNFRPISFKNMDILALGIIHPYQAAQLRLNENFAKGMREAMPRDAKGNLLFSGKIFGDCIGYWNGILLVASNYIHSGNQSTFTDLIATEGGSNTVEIDSALGTDNVRRALFLGGEAMAIAEGTPPHYESDVFDYNNKEGIAVSGIFGMRRCDFTSDDSDATVTNQSTLVLSTYSPATAI